MAMMSKKEWYLKAPPKIRREWSSKERHMILLIREDGSSIQNIIDLMGGKVTACQIHNQLRLARKALKGRCFQCGQPVKKKMKSGLDLCRKCRAERYIYKKSRREDALSKNLCGICYKQPVVPGHTTCKNCASSTFRRRLEKGLCQKCGERPVYKKRSKVFCKECL